MAGDDVAELGFKVDSSSVKTASDDLKNFESVARRTGETAEQVRDRFKKMGDEAKKLADAERLAGTEAKRAAEEMEKVSRFANAQATAMSGLNRQIFAMASGLGLVGQVMASAAGPWLALAVVIKLVVDAITEVREIAQRAGEKAADLRNLSEAVRLSIDEIRALKKLGGEFGVGSDQIETWLQRASFSIENARLGTGQLIEALNKISPVFSMQMQATTTMAQGLDVLSRAAAQAKVQGQDVALFWRDVFGRGSGRADPVFTAVQLAGGIETLGQKMHNFGGAMSEEIEKRASLSRSIEVESAKRESLKASIIGTSAILSLELKALKEQNDILLKVLAAKNSILGSYGLTADAQQAAIKLYGSEAEAIKEVSAAEEARATAALRMGRGQARAGQKAAGISFQDPGAIAPTGAMAVDEAGMIAFKTAADNLQLKANQAFNNLTKLMTVLGAASTIQEQTALSLAKLNKEFENNEHGLTEGTKAYRDRIEASIRLNEATQLLALKTSILGQAASVEDNLLQKIQARQKAEQQGASFTPQQIANIDRINRATADGTLAMQQQADGMRIEIATIGMATDKATAYRLEQEKITEAKRFGREVSEQTSQAWAREAKAAGDVALALDKARIAQDIKRDRQSVFLSSEDVAIANQLKAIYPDIATALSSAEAAAMRTTNALKSMKDMGQQFLSTLLDAVMSGKSLNESLKQSLDSLAKMAANAALKNLLEGNFVMAAVDATVAVASKIGAGLFDDSQQKAIQKAKENFAAMAGDITKFNAAAAGFNLSPIIDELSSLTQQWTKLGGAATDAQDFGKLKELNTTFEHGVDRILKSYLGLNSAMSDSGKQIEQAKADAIGMADALHQAGLGMSQAADFANNGLIASIDRIKNALNGSLQSDIFNATGRGFINDIQSLVTQRNQLLSEGNADPALVQMHFAVMAQKVIDDAGLIGDSFTDLTKMFPQLSTAVVESKTALEDQAKASKEASDRLQAAFNQAATGILNYVNNLRTGTDTNLSPSARLALAQSTYNATLGLAQGGNADALGRITSDFENFRKAAQDFYGSSTSYQNILNAGISQLLALPAVQTSTDPVVQALLDVQSKIQATTTAVTGTTTAVGGTTAAANATKAAVDTSNALLTATQAILSVSRDQLVQTQIGQAQELAQLSNIQANTSTTVAVIQDSKHIIGRNTYLITYNAQVLNPGKGVLTGIDAATGGAIFGGTPNQDSVRINAMAGEFIVRKDVAQANKWLQSFNATGRLPKFDEGNSRLEAKLDQLIKTFSAVGAAMVNAEYATSQDTSAEIVEALGGVSKSIRDEARQDRATRAKEKVQ